MLGMKKSLGVMVASVLLAATGACGGTESGAGSDTSNAADTSQADAATAVDTSGELTKDNFVERLGAAQLKAGSSHMEMTMSLGVTEAIVSGDMLVSEKPEDVKAAMTMDMGQMKMDIRMIGTVMYMNMGQLSGGKFFKLDLNDSDNPLTQQYGSMTEQLDPSEQLEKFRAGLVEFDHQGDGGTVDGVETSKIRLVLDTKKTLDLSGEDADNLGAKMPETLEYTLFVGEDDLMRKMEIDLGGMPSTIEWSKWGEPVQVEAPAESEITDTPSLGFTPPKI